MNIYDNFPRKYPPIKLQEFISRLALWACVANFNTKILTKIVNSIPAPLVARP